MAAITEIPKEQEDKKMVTALLEKEPEALGTFKIVSS